MTRDFDREADELIEGGFVNPDKRDELARYFHAREQLEKLRFSRSESSMESIVKAIKDLRARESELHRIGTMLEGLSARPDLRTAIERARTHMDSVKERRKDAVATEEAWTAALAAEHEFSAAMENLQKIAASHGTRGR